MVEKVPLGHIELTFRDLLAESVAGRIVAADAGGTAHEPLVLASGSDALLTAGIGELCPAGAILLVERGRVEDLQAHVDVERRGRERTQCSADRRSAGHVEMAGAEALHFELVTRDAGEVQTIGLGNAFAVLVHVDWIEDRIEAGSS